MNVSSAVAPRLHPVSENPKLSCRLKDLEFVKSALKSEVYLVKPCWSIGRPSWNWDCMLLPSCPYIDSFTGNRPASASIKRQIFCTLRGRAQLVLLFAHTAWHGVPSARKKNSKFGRSKISRQSQWARSILVWRLTEWAQMAHFAPSPSQGRSSATWPANGSTDRPPRQRRNMMPSY